MESILYLISPLGFRILSVGEKGGMFLKMDKKMAGMTGIEPAISGLTGQRVRPDCTTAPQRIILVGGTGLEPMASGL